MDQLSGRINEEKILVLMSEEEKQKHAELTAKIKEIAKLRPDPFPTARAVQEKGREPQPSYFLHRGSIDSKGTQMSPGVLTVAWDGKYEFPSPPPDANSSWRRRGFAEWIASPDNPLTARVMVNRLWQHHFGEGIVRTPSNFGKTGEAPSHQALLDWMAVEFVKRGWSMKQMHRLMLTSEAYQMASDDIAANLAIDPENRLFWRAARQRLDAETIRDAMLSVAGTLDPTLGVPAFSPTSIRICSSPRPSALGRANRIRILRRGGAVFTSSPNAAFATRYSKLSTSRTWSIRVIAETGPRSRRRRCC
jgi:hypothetical protein